MERRLAAVLIADVVGYGRLSQVDEEGTRARFQADLREVFEPKIAACRGRLIKTMGDGILVEFPSVVDALRCAVEIQQEKARRNAAAPAEQRLDFRIGVNLGDIIVEGDDIHGDGVNIADRLQALAEPGGVAISGTAYDQVKAKLPVGYASLGEQKVKSIAEPIRVYRVVLDPAAVGKTIAAPRGLRPWRVPAAAAAVVALLLAGAGAWWQSWQTAGDPAGGQNVAAVDTRPSLVVLPFDNLSSDAEQGYLADGITEDLTTELARIPGLFVISRNAAFTYRDKPVQPTQVATELGVRYILEGSIRRAGDDLRINAQLIDATTSGHMWAERFDGAFSEVFALQDKVIENVGMALKLRLVSGQSADAAGGTSVVAAYDAYLKGLDFRRRGSAADWTKADSLLKQAVELDPNFGRAWAELADMHWISYGNPEREAALGVASEDMMGKANAYLDEAAKHPSPPYYGVLTDFLIVQQRSDEGVAAMERAIALDPSDPSSYEGMAQALIYNGRAADGKAYLDTAMRVDPRQTTWRYKEYGLAYFCMGRYEEAIATLEKIDPETPELWHRYYGMFFLLAAHAHLGHASEAAAVKKQLGRLTIKIQNANLSGLEARSQFPFKQPVDTERLLDGLRKAGVPELPFSYDWNSPDRLTGEEIRSLLFGHDTEGSDPATGERYTRRTAIDGTTEVSDSSGPDHGFSRIEGDTLCRWVTRRARSCHAIFRNPAGTFEKRNEYLWISPWSHLQFSVVK